MDPMATCCSCFIFQRSECQTAETYNLRLLSLFAMKTPWSGDALLTLLKVGGTFSDCPLIGFGLFWWHVLEKSILQTTVGHQVVKFSGRPKNGQPLCRAGSIGGPVLEGHIVGR